MNNNTIQNNGNQFFQENNFYSHDQVCCKTNDCISSVTKMAKFSSTVIITVVGFVADLLAIGISFKELKIEDI